MSLSRTSKNRAPRRKPKEAGIQFARPSSVALSMEGMSKDQTEAAIITPAAKPKKALWRRSGISFLKKKTMADPAAVMEKVKPVAHNTIRRGDTSYSEKSKLFYDM